MRADGQPARPGSTTTATEHLDLFVSNYVKFSYNDSHRCEFKGERTYCAQTAYEGDRPTLFHNNGDGTFTDVTEKRVWRSWLGAPGRGEHATSMTTAGPDLFVARDASPNLLLITSTTVLSRNAALDAEVALSAEGAARAGMGVDSGDVNGDGRPDFIVTNFNDEQHTLFLNLGKFPFHEATRESGLAALTRFYVGWGAHFIDYDNDGNLDLVLANGHINPVIEKTRMDVL